MSGFSHIKKLISIKDYQGAITELLSIIDQDNQNIQAWFYLAQVYERGTKDIDNAKDCYRQVIKLDGNNTKAISRLESLLNAPSSPAPISEKNTGNSRGKTLGWIGLVIVILVIIIYGGKAIYPYIQNQVAFAPTYTPVRTIEIPATSTPIQIPPTWTPTPEPRNTPQHTTAPPTSTPSISLDELMPSRDDLPQGYYLKDSGYRDIFAVSLFSNQQPIYNQTDDLYDVHFFALQLENSQTANSYFSNLAQPQFPNELFNQAYLVNENLSFFESNSIIYGTDNYKFYSAYLIGDKNTPNIINVIIVQYDNYILITLSIAFNTNQNSTYFSQQQSVEMMNIFLSPLKK